MGVVATWPWWGWPPAPPHALHLSLRPLEGALGGVTLMRVVALSHLSEGCTLAPPPHITSPTKHVLGHILS